MGREIKKGKSRYRSTGGPEGRDFNEGGPKNTSSRPRGEGSEIKEPVSLFNLAPGPVTGFLGKAKVIPKWEDVRGPERGRMTDRWTSSRGPKPEGKGTARESLVEGNMAGVHVIDRLLVSRESDKAPVPDISDLLEIGRVGTDETRRTGSPDTDPHLTGGKEGDQVGVGLGTRMGGFANAHPGKLGAPKSIFEREVAEVVVVGEDPSGRKARK